MPLMQTETIHPVAAVMLIFVMGCGCAAKKSQVSEFDGRFESIQIGMTRSEALAALGLGRHEVYEIEHPDGRLVHTKLYWYAMPDGGESVRWEFKVDADLRVVSKRREASNQSVERPSEAD